MPTYSSKHLLTKQTTPRKTKEDSRPFLRQNGFVINQLLFYFCLLLSALYLSFPTVTKAQDHWPSRNIHMIVPFPGGSSPDLLSRTLAEHLSDALEQTIVVENK